MPAHVAPNADPAAAEGNIGHLVVGHMMTSEVAPRGFLGVVVRKSRQGLGSCGGVQGCTEAAIPGSDRIYRACGLLGAFGEKGAVRRGLRGRNR